MKTGPTYISAHRMLLSFMMAIAQKHDRNRVYGASCIGLKMSTRTTSSFLDLREFVMKIKTKCCLEKIINNAQGSAFIKEIHNYKYILPIENN